MQILPQAISIVVPTLNEAGNVKRLVGRLHRSLTRARIPYEIIFVDDHSTDGTERVVSSLAAHYTSGTLRLYQKQGKPGKAYSLLEGFERAAYPLVCMIDADLQYPPEAIAPMYRQMQRQQADIVVTERVDLKTSRLNQLRSGTFNLLFTRLMFGIDFDSQSGLKLFKKQILQHVTLSPSPWSFDLEFLVRSLEQRYRVVSHQIPFAGRVAGQSKVHAIGTSIELAKASISLRRTTSIEKVKQSYQADKDRRDSWALSQQPMRVIAPLMVATALLFASVGPAAHAQALAPLQSLKQPLSTITAPVVRTVQVTTDNLAPVVQPSSVEPQPSSSKSADTTVDTTPVSLPVSQPPATAPATNSVVVPTVTTTLPQTQPAPAAVTLPFIPSAAAPAPIWQSSLSTASNYQTGTMRTAPAATGPQESSVQQSSGVMTASLQGPASTPITDNQTAGQPLFPNNAARARNPYLSLAASPFHASAKQYLQFAAYSFIIGTGLLLGAAFKFNKIPARLLHHQ